MSNFVIISPKGGEIVSPIPLIMQNISWFSADNIVAITAVIGCFTGCISFGMMLQKALKEKIKFQLKIEDSTIHFNKPINFGLDTETVRQGLIRVTSINLSYTPATIHTIKIYPKYQKNKEIIFWIRDTDSILIPYLNENEEKQFHEFSMSNQYDLPVRLEAFDAFSGFIFLRHLDVHPNEDLTLIVEFYVGKQKFKTECTLIPIEEYVGQ